MQQVIGGVDGAAGPLAIVVNGAPMETTAASLFELLCELGLGEARVATARNGAFVPAAARAGTAIVAGDRIEVVSARQGG
ncbi:MAG: sulfur carrier protein ThiS [Pseudomonadota bacterium]